MQGMQVGGCWCTHMSLRVPKSVFLCESPHLSVSAPATPLSVVSPPLGLLICLHPNALPWALPGPPPV